MTSGVKRGSPTVIHPSVSQRPAEATSPAAPQSGSSATTSRSIPGNLSKIGSQKTTNAPSRFEVKSREQTPIKNANNDSLNVKKSGKSSGMDKSYSHNDGEEFGMLEVLTTSKDPGVIDREFKARDEIVAKRPEMERFLPKMKWPDDSQGLGSNSPGRKKVLTEHLEILHQVKPKTISGPFGKTSSMVTNAIKQIKDNKIDINDVLRDLRGIKKNLDVICANVGELTLSITKKADASKAAVRIIDLAPGKGHAVIGKNGREPIEKGLDNLIDALESKGA